MFTIQVRGAVGDFQKSIKNGEEVKKKRSVRLLKEREPKIMSILQNVGLTSIVPAGLAISFAYALVRVELDRATDRARARKQQRTACTGFFITEDEIAAETRIPRWLVRLIFNLERVRKKMLAA